MIAQLPAVQALLASEHLFWYPLGAFILAFLFGKKAFQGSRQLFLPPERWRQKKASAVAANHAANSPAPLVRHATLEQAVMELEKQRNWASGRETNALELAFVRQVLWLMYRWEIPVFHTAVALRIWLAASPHVKLLTDSEWAQSDGEDCVIVVGLGLGAFVSLIAAGSAATPGQPSVYAFHEGELCTRLLPSPTDGSDAPQLFLVLAEAKA
jgi:hypothetical protein